MFYKWYTIFPGVPTTIWGFLSKALTSLDWSRPPIIVATFKSIDLPRALKWSPICTHNSRVGARMRAKKKVGFYKSASKMGKAKAKVLPLPVSAKAIISFPFKVYGSDWAWIGVGFV